MAQIRSKITRIKKLKNSFKILNRLSRKQSYSVSSLDFNNNSSITLLKNDRGFSFLFKHDELLFKINQFDFDNILVERSGMKFRINKIYATQRTFGETSGIVGSFNSLNFDKKKEYYHRLIIPTSLDPNFIFSVENVALQYKYEQQIKTRLAIEIQISMGTFHLYQVSKKLTEKKPTYIVIDSQDSMEFKEFSETCHSILISFGFVSGSLFQNEGFFFQYKDVKMNVPLSFFHTRFRESIMASYIPIYSNPHGIIHDSNIADEYKNRIDVISSINFSNLCQLTHDEVDIKSALFLILETNNVSLVSSPGLLSIALETIANFVYRKNEQGLTPIPEKFLAREIRKELKQLINKYSAKISDTAKSILNNRIDQINQRTNREKLMIPFELLGIKLSETDIKSIEQRNSFLHGKIPMIQDEKPATITEEDKLRYFLHLKLFTLVAALILKLADFKGHIVNYPKLYESVTGIELDEDFYRQI